MATNQSSKTVFLALSVNFFIAIVKTIISVVTSSSAMFSEAIHSYVDSANQFILWFGMKQSKKTNKKIYPLGRGKEEYYWTLVVAVLIFTIGGLVSLEHGIEALAHPHELKNLYISIIVLTVSIILESYVLYKAVKQLQQTSNQNKSIMKLLKESKLKFLLQNGGSVIIYLMPAQIDKNLGKMGTLRLNNSSPKIFERLNLPSFKDQTNTSTPGYTSSQRNKLDDKIRNLK